MKKNILAAFLGSMLGSFILLPLVGTTFNIRIPLLSTAIESERANYSSIAIEILKEADKGKHLDPTRAAAALAAVKVEEGGWSDKVFGKDSEPEDKWKVVTSNSPDLSAVAIVIDPNSNTVVVLKGSMKYVLGDIKIFDWVKSTPVGVYDQKDPHPSTKRLAEIYANAFDIINRFNFKLLPKKMYIMPKQSLA